VRQPSKDDGGFGKLDCFFRFDQLHYWLSRMRDLIATSETYAFPAFRESFRELRRNSVKAEFELSVALNQFETRMENESRPRGRRIGNKEEER
jgi:hypothetical protein